MSSSLFEEIVVSSLRPVARPAPTQKPASNSDTRNIVLREYVGRAQDRKGSSNLNKSAKSGAVHIAGFFAGDQGSKRIACGLGNE